MRAICIGHVGIVEGYGNLLDANGYSMDLTSEPLDEAIARIERFFERPIGCWRPPAGVAGQADSVFSQRSEPRGLRQAALLFDWRQAIASNAHFAAALASGARSVPDPATNSCQPGS